MNYWFILQYLYNLSEIKLVAVGHSLIHTEDRYLQKQYDTFSLSNYHFTEVSFPQ